MAGPLKNARHERFAQELAKGKSQEDAYAAAGYNPSRSAASRLAADVNICQRLAELTERVAEKTVLSVAALTDRLMKIADVAELTGVETDEETGKVVGSSSKHLNVMRAAIMDAAKLNGMVIDKAKVDMAGGFNITISSDDAAL